MNVGARSNLLALALVCVRERPVRRGVPQNGRLDAITLAMVSQ